MNDPANSLDFHAIAQIPTNARTTYWLDIWDEQLRLYLYHPQGFQFWDIRVTLDILIADSARRHYQSEGIRKVLIDGLQLAMTCHPILKKGIRRNSLALLKTDFEKRENVLARRRAMLIASDIDSESYSSALTNELVTILVKDAPLSSQGEKDLSILTSDIIARLFRVGFSQQAIFDIPRRIFSTIMGEGESATTNFPKQYLQFPHVTGDMRTWIPLTPIERAALALLNLSDRVAVLARYMHATPRTITCIFGIEGLYGRKQASIGPVTFYCPVVERFLPGGSDTEIMGQDPNLNPINAKVDILALDEMAARDKAHALVEHALNIMNLGARRPVPMTIRNIRAISKDPMGLGLYSYTERVAQTADTLDVRSNPILSLHSSVDSMHVPEELISGDFPSQGLVHEISTSLHWLRRAEEATRPEDSLLFHWLAFEKLFDDQRLGEPVLASTRGVFETIEVLYPVLDAYIYAHQCNQMIANYIHAFWDGGMSRNFPPRFGPNALHLLLNDLRSQTPEEIVAQLRGIDMQANEGRFATQVRKQLSIIDDAKESRKFLNEMQERSAREIRIIYWLRNRLVHGGDFRFPALPYYTSVLAAATRWLLTIVADTRNWHGQPQHPIDILTLIYIEARSMLCDLSKDVGTIEQCMATRVVLNPLRS
jgi:hypothetical protein